MPTLRCQISISLDGYIAGPNQSEENPLGEGGMDLHEWVFKLESWQVSHGRQGGETNASSAVIESAVADVGAVIMGRGMFGGGPGPWPEDPAWEGWWGDDPPFHAPVFVLTHHEREPLVLGDTTFEFVTDGIEPAYERAAEAAGEKGISLGGGAEAIRQYLAAGRVDELTLNVVPILLGSGEGLFDGLGGTDLGLEPADSFAGPEATHLVYRRAS